MTEEPVAAAKFAPNPAPKPAPWRGALIALAGAAAVGGYLYAQSGQTGKESANGACAASRAVAKAAAPFAKGEVAAMAIASDPEPLPALAFLGPDGGPKTLADFKGKTVLFNAWATWCVPCRAEMPALNRLQTSLGSDKFEVVAVNIDTARLDRPKAFLNEIGVKSLTFYSDPKANIFFQMKQDLGATGLPTTFLIDPAGCRLGTMAGPAAWDSEEGRALVSAVVAASASAPKAAP